VKRTGKKTISLENERDTHTNKNDEDHLFAARKSKASSGVVICLIWMESERQKIAGNKKKNLWISL